MARVCFGRRGSAGGMEPIRGCALGVALPAIRLRQIRGAQASERAARAAVAARRAARARARCSAWEIGRIGWERSRKDQHAPHRAGRGEAQAKAFLRLRGGFDDCLSQTEPLTGFGLDQKQRLRHYSLEFSRWISFGLAALCISRPREKAARGPKSRIGFLLAGKTAHPGPGS